MNIDQSFALERLGAAPKWQGMTLQPDIPDFGALPPIEVAQQANNLMASSVPSANQQPVPQEAPKVKYNPTSDLGKWLASEIEAGNMNEQGLSLAGDHKGMLYYGPEATAYRKSLKPDKNKWNKAETEALEKKRVEEIQRALGGVNNTPATDYGEVPEDRKTRGLTPELWNLANDIVRQKVKGSAQAEQWAQQIVTPGYSNRENTRLGIEDKRRRAIEAQKRNIDFARDSANNALRTIDLIEKNVNDTGLPETGLLGAGLSWLPMTDAYALYKDVGALKGMIAQGGLLDIKAASPNGASGFGALNRDELQLLKDRIATLDPKLGKERFLSDLLYIKDRFNNALKERAILDSDLEQPQQSTDKPAKKQRLRFTNTGDLLD